MKESSIRFIISSSVRRTAIETRCWNVLYVDVVELGRDKEEKAYEAEGAC